MRHCSCQKQGHELILIQDLRTLLCQCILFSFTRRYRDVVKRFWNCSFSILFILLGCPVRIPSFWKSGSIMWIMETISLANLKKRFWIWLNIFYNPKFFICSLHFTRLMQAFSTPIALSPSDTSHHFWGVCIGRTQYMCHKNLSISRDPASMCVGPVHQDKFIIFALSMYGVERR